jgi:hypothetical protein
MWFNFNMSTSFSKRTVNIRRYFRKMGSYGILLCDILWLLCSTKSFEIWQITNCLFFYYRSTALCWALAAFSVSWSYTQSVELLGRGISRSQGRYLHTGQHKHRIKAHNTDIHALSGIRTHDPSGRTSGHCDRQKEKVVNQNIFHEAVLEEYIRRTRAAIHFRSQYPHPTQKRNI